MHKHKANLPRAFQTTVLRRILCVYEGPSDPCVVSSAALPSVNRLRLPNRGALKWKWWRGQAVTKCAERRERGRVRQRAAGPDKYPHTQTTTTRGATRNEQWHQESGTQRGSMAASSWETRQWIHRSDSKIQASKLTSAELVKEKSDKLTQNFSFSLDFHLSKKQT